MTRNNKRNVFITGAGGFVGSNLVRRLIKENYSVHILNHHDELPWRLTSIAHMINVHQGDLTNFSRLRRILSNVNPDYILHLAVNGAYHYQNDLKQIVKVNVNGTENLLRASANIPYLSFINTGTSSEYGYKSRAMRENDVCNPNSYYAATKLAATQLCKVFATLEDKPIATFRLFSVFGPYEAPTRLIPAVIMNIINRTSISLSAENLRHDFIYIDDVCSAYIKAMKLGDKLKGEIINIGTGMEYSNKEVVEHAFSITKRETNVVVGKYNRRAWDTTHWKADTTNMKKMLEFTPEFSIDKGLQKTYSWFVRNRTLYQSIYEKKQ